MATILSSYTLLGIEAVAMDVVVGRDRVQVDLPGTDKILYLVKLGMNASEAAGPSHVVNARTYPRHNLPPACRQRLGFVVLTIKATERLGSLELRASLRPPRGKVKGPAIISRVLRSSAVSAASLLL
jgi:hypothetical protein